jgi:hypothetical protein
MEAMGAMNFGGLGVAALMMGLLLVANTWVYRRQAA